MSYHTLVIPSAEIQATEAPDIANGVVDLRKNPAAQSCTQTGTKESKCYIAISCVETVLKRRKWKKKRLGMVQLKKSTGQRDIVYNLFWRKSRFPKMKKVISDAWTCTGLENKNIL